MRYAIYFVPDPDSEPFDIGTRWLGYDIETGTTFAAPVVAGLEAAAWSRLIGEPARYGFHATLKAPFRLAEGMGEAELVDGVRAFARSVAPVRLPVLSLTYLRGFFALMPSVRNQPVEDFSASAVRAFERFRAPLSASDTTRRQANGLSARQKALLESWGYPYVLEEASFHMTLTGRVSAEEAPRVRSILADAFAPVIGHPLIVDRVALAVEREPGALFEVLAASTLGHPLAEPRRAMRLGAM